MKKIDIHIWRRTVQTGVAATFIVLPVLNANGFDFIWGNFLNIHIGGFTFADPLAVLQVIVKNRYLPLGLLVSAGMVLAIAVCLGTVFCSWICPFGLLSELVNRLSCRFRPIKGSNRAIRKNGFAIKTIIFCIGFVISWAFFSRPLLNRMSLPFQYSNVFQYLFVQQQVTSAMGFIGGVLLTEFIFGTRLWCRWICPQAVLLVVAKRINPFRLKVVFEKKRCEGCRAPCPCQTACSLDLDPRQLNGKMGTECTNCGDCVDACRQRGQALCFRFGRYKK